MLFYIFVRHVDLQINVDLKDIIPLCFVTPKSGKPIVNLTLLTKLTFGSLNLLIATLSENLNLTLLEKSKIV